MSKDEKDLVSKLSGLSVRDSDEKPVKNEPERLTLEDIAHRINSGKIKRIITMAGAGISTSAGIPDFRSETTGLYATIAKRYPDLPCPEDIFDIEFFRENPKPFYEFAKELLPPADGGGYQPTPCHKFIKKLSDKGLLLRHYTQNIDGLERQAGVPARKLVEAHGSFSLAHCIDCQEEHSEEFVRGADFFQCFFLRSTFISFTEQVFKNQTPVCSRCKSLVKPDIVFFGENLPDRFNSCVNNDFRKCDLLIILGTSLKVYPFAGLVSS